MIRGLKRRFDFGVLGTYMALCVLVPTNLAAEADLDTLETKIQSEEKELSLLLEKIESGQKRLGELKVQQSSARARISKNQDDYKAIAKKIEGTEKEIVKVDDDLQKANENLSTAKKTFAAYEASFYLRLAHFYRNQNQPFLKILLQSGSLGDLSNRLHYYRRIVESDSGQFEKLKEQSKLIRINQQEIQKKTSQLSTLSKQLITEKNALLSRIHTDKEHLKKMYAEQQNLEERATKMDESSQYLKDRIQNLISARDQLQSDLDNRHLGELMDKRKEIERGSLDWPLRGDFKIQRRFGHESRSTATLFSPGIDLEPSEPQSIYASEDGIIFYRGTPAGSSSTYGKVVMVAHGKFDGKFTTLYGNLSTILVALNQTVKRGDKIATISANNNLGQYQPPRLHYQVRINGEPTDPLVWLKNKEKI